MIRIKKHIPNLFTSFNLISGFVAIVYAFQSDFMMAFYFIGIAAFFDFIDGGVARLLNEQSELGKQLDSLCDVVSFGLAPGFILFSMMRHSLDISLPIDLSALSLLDLLLLFSVVVVPVFSVLRLAKFNIDTRQSDSFIGMPVPANAIFIASLGALLISSHMYWVKDLLMNPYCLLLIALIQSYLLVSPLPMFALKFKNLSWKDNYLQFLFLLAVLILIVSMGIAGIALSIVLYLLLSLIVRMTVR